MHHLSPEPNAFNKVLAVGAAWDRILECYQAAEQAQKLECERAAARASHLRLPLHCSQCSPVGGLRRAVTSASARPDPSRRYRSLRVR